MVTNHHSKGFSLIELMITMALAGLLIALGSSLSTGWFDSAYEQQAHSLLTEGISRTRSIALRNPSGVNDEVQTTAAAALCLTDQTLSVAYPNCTDASKTVAWSAKLPEQIIVKEANNNNVFFCLGINNRGLFIADNLGNQSCDLKSGTSSNDLYICPCALSNHSQHSSLCNFTLGTDDSACRKVEFN